MQAPRKLKIGRDSKNDIVLTHRSISRDHVEVFINEFGDVFITDLNSSNGTYINGSRLSGSCMLEPGDILRLGVEKPIKWQLWTNATEQSFDQNNIENCILDESYPDPPSTIQKIKTYINVAIITFLILITLFFVFKNIEKNQEEKHEKTTEQIKSDKADERSIQNK